MLDEGKYAITLAVAGFKQDELDINVDRGVLSVRGEKEKSSDSKYLHRGIANRTFERKFNLADYIEVRGAELEDGLLTINLEKEVPETLRPKKIEISKS